MKFDTKTHQLPENNFIKRLSLKKQIVLVNSFNNNMKHVIGWKLRFNGKYKKTAPFTIAKDGTIYKHFDPHYNAEYFSDLNLNSKTIVIVIENDGWLVKNDQKNSFITLAGDIYNEKEGIVEKKWRNNSHWASYNSKQVDSVIFLINELCDEFFIPKNAISHNTNIDDIGTYEGIIYRSNMGKQYSDLSPAWDFLEFKNKLEKDKNK